jgi:DNA-binding NarL/FixJ family response regulator
MIRVMVVEDQTLVRQGIRSLLALAKDIEVVAEAPDGEEALRLIPEVKPDLVLLDLRMPKMGGVEVLRHLQKTGTSPPVIVLTTFDDNELLRDAVHAGARGYLLKDVSLERLTGSIRKVASGESDIQPAVTEKVLEALKKAPPQFDSSGLPEPMTERETEVLRLIASGLANREIADALAISEGTVKNHTSSILGKLGVRDRTRAVLRAIDLGFLK